MKLELSGVEWGVGELTLVNQISFQVESGELVGLLGPNGSGKSSLLRTVYRVNQPRAGRVLLDQENVWDHPPLWLAQRTATVLQESPLAFDYSVAEVVMMGRIPHQQSTLIDSTADRKAVKQALEQVGLSDFEERGLATLSGGERQRVLVARALAQEPQFLVLDEPTNHLDVRHRLEVLGLVRRLAVGVLASLHDLNLAAHFCDRLVLLNRGQLVAQGVPEEVLTPELLREVYQVEAEVDRHPRTAKLRVTFLPD